MRAAQRNDVETVACSRCITIALVRLANFSGLHLTAGGSAARPPCCCSRFRCVILGKRVLNNSMSGMVQRHSLMSECGLLQVVNKLADAYKDRGTATTAVDCPTRENKACSIRYCVILWLAGSMQHTGPLNLWGRGFPPRAGSRWRPLRNLLHHYLLHVSCNNVLMSCAARRRVSGWHGGVLEAKRLAQLSSWIRTGTLAPSQLREMTDACQ